MKTRSEKETTIATLVSQLEEASSIYLVNFQGLPVEKDNALRKNLNAKGVSYQAVKNTLLQRALAKIGITGLDEYLVGSTALMLGDSEDPMMPARELVEFHKQNPDFLEAKGISLDGQLMPGSQLETVAKMPGRADLLAQIVATILGPGATLVSIIKGPGATLAGQVKALEEKLEKAG